MKKFLLVSFLCITPLFVSHAAADLTVEDCANWLAYNETNSQDSFNKLPKGIQDAHKNNSYLSQWVSQEKHAELWINLNKELYYVCDNIEKGLVYKDEKSINRALKGLTLFLQKSLADYETLETRKRIPFVRHGDVLPGPTADEDGSFYVEQKFIPKFVNGSLIFLMSLSILMVIIGGLMFLFSSGDSELTSRAKTTILWAIVGVVLTILAYAIVQFIIGIDFSLQ